MGFSLGNVFKPIKKTWDTLARASREGGADVLRIASGMTGGALDKYVDMTEPGNSSVRNAQKRADFEYARSLADQSEYSSVQRRVAEAKAAGIHPLAALGYQAPSFIPPQNDNYYAGGQEYGLQQMGQDISRAVAASQTEGERRSAQATQSVVDNLAIQRMRLEVQGLFLENQYRLSQLVRLREGVGPGFAPTNSNSVGGQNVTVGTNLPDRMAIQAVGMQELYPSDNWHEVTDRSGFRYLAPPSGEDNELAQAEAFFRNKVLYHALGPFRRAGAMGNSLKNYYGGYKPTVYPDRPYRVKNRVRGSRISSYHTQ